MNPQRPKHTIILYTYQELDQYARAFGSGHLNLMILVGAPGLQKSHVVHAAVGSDICWIEGTATPFRLYCELWEHRDQLVVIDDVDSLCTDPKAEPSM